MLKKFFGGGRVWGVGCGVWGSGEVGKWGVGCGVWGVGCRVLAIFRGKVPEFSPRSLQGPVLIEQCF
ncbi:hypothetical protein [Microcystis sp. M049S2]|uniref:hypothetical protein n=1 Tax=Microcystis sp. M049S2 TaxID=2771169 RepID=UPI0025853DFA|nr:hypothetical protein [Microcystis sp. M049S2]